MVAVTDGDQSTIAYFVFRISYFVLCIAYRISRIVDRGYFCKIVR